MRFVHLHTHSYYSFMRGTAGLEALCRSVLLRGMDTVALTDTNGLYGLVIFLQIAEETGIRPIIGAEVVTPEEYLGSVAERLTKKGIKTTYKVIAGDPAHMIVEHINDEKVSLVAMSTHGRTGIARWILGSVADKVLHEAEVPMFLVRSPKMITARHKE